MIAKRRDFKTSALVQYNLESKGDFLHVVELLTKYHKVSSSIQASLLSYGVSPAGKYIPERSRGRASRDSKAGMIG